MAVIDHPDMSPVAARLFILFKEYVVPLEGYWWRNMCSFRHERQDRMFVVVLSKTSAQTLLNSLNDSTDLRAW